MFDENAQNLADRLYRDALRGRETHLRDSLRDIISEATQHGATGAGRFHLKLGEIYAEEFHARAALLWDVVQQVLSAHGVVPSIQLARTLKEFLAPRLSRECSDLTERLRKDGDRFRAGPSLPAAVSGEFTPVEEGLYAKVDLLVLQLDRTSERDGRGATVQNFYGSNVGVVQTGPNATATSYQTITTGDVGLTERALASLAEALQSVTEAGGYTQKELLSTVVELSQEIRKPQPNRLKVGQLASGLAVAIQATGSLKPAYDLVRAAFLSWGIQLPI